MVNTIVGLNGTVVAVIKKILEDSIKFLRDKNRNNILMSPYITEIECAEMADLLEGFCDKYYK